MPAIVLETELYKRVEQAAIESEITTEEIVSEAAKRYLWELNRRKISEESRLYQEQHARLKLEYLGQYVAMFKGQIVDHDLDFEALHDRVRQDYPYEVVMITLVQETAVTTLVRRGFRYGNEPS